MITAFFFFFFNFFLLIITLTLRGLGYSRTVFFQVDLIGLLNVVELKVYVYIYFPI